MEIVFVTTFAWALIATLLWLRERRRKDDVDSVVFWLQKAHELELFAGTGNHKEPTMIEINTRRAVNKTIRDRALSAYEGHGEDGY